MQKTGLLVNASKVRTYKYLALAILLTCATLVVSRFSSLPTGYRHSWNQIATLTHIRDIATARSSWNIPHDTTTRVVWKQDASAVDRDISFRTFEEFPLYHLLSSFGANETDASLISSARRLSLSLLLLTLISLILLQPNRREQLLALCLFCTSAPLLYYGQAIMSDIGMLAFLSVGVFFADKSYHSDSKGAFLIAGAAFCIAGLFKSYGIAFTPLLIFVVILKKPFSIRYFLASIIVVAVCACPTIAWHAWSLAQEGHHEGSSHSFKNKVLSLQNLELYVSLLKNYFSYLGYVAGTVCILFTCYLISIKDGTTKVSRVWWFRPWLLLSLLYLVVTADKLRDHDYYLLPLMPLGISWASQKIHKAFKLLENNFSNKIVTACLLLIFVPDGVLAAKAFIKTTSENSDVTLCAKIVEANSFKEDLIATMSNVSRYNSIAYFSDRQAINVEETAFPVSRYLKAGAKFLIVNKSPSELAAIEPWLRENSPHLSLIQEQKLKDFKGRERTCRMYKLTPKAV